MFTCEVTKEDLAFADRMAERNVGNRGQGDGDPQSQWNGHLGESVVNRLLRMTGADVVIQEKDGDDRGEDGRVQGYVYDTKTQAPGRIPVKVGPEYECPIFAEQVDYNKLTEVYVFGLVNGDKDVFAVLGVARVDRFLRYAELRKKGEYLYRLVRGEMVSKYPFYIDALVIRFEHLVDVRNKYDLALAITSEGYKQKEGL